jgi:pimeloyl-[acyl-carrier protein] methyl ester esterase
MSLHIEKLGHGEPLVMIHGWGMHSGMWMQAKALLIQHFELHLIDLPGMGYSESLSEYDLDKVAQEIALCIPKNAYLLGWSLGGLIAMKIAMHQAVKKLVLIGSTPCFVNREDWQLGTPIEVFQTFFADVIQDFESTMHKLLALIAMGGGNARGTAKVLKQEFSARPLPSEKALQDTLNILLHTDLRQELSQITAPTLLLHGEHDKLAPIGAAVWLSTALPNAKLHEIKGAAHEPFLSHPQGFADTIVEFLKT